MTTSKIPDMRLAVYPKDGGSPHAIVAVDVAPEGIAFIRSEMLQYGPLSRRVAELFGTGGIAFAPMQEGATYKYVKRFDIDSSDSTIQIGTEAAHKWLAEYATLRWGKTGCQVIIEEPWLKINDEIFGKPDGRYFGREDFPYYTSKTGNLFKDLEEAAGQTSFLRFGFIISPPVSLPPNGMEADAHTIEALAQNTRMAFISAYDNMGYVVWMSDITVL
jgi:hypothetical protein